MPLEDSSSSVSIASVFWPTRAIMSWHDISLQMIWSFTPFTAGVPAPSQPQRPPPRRSPRSRPRCWRRGRERAAQRTVLQDHYGRLSVDAASR